jgi:hypothetical protein
MPIVVRPSRLVTALTALCVAVSAQAAETAPLTFTEYQLAAPRPDIA